MTCPERRALSERVWFGVAPRVVIVAGVRLSLAPRNASSPESLSLRRREMPSCMPWRWPPVKRSVLRSASVKSRVS